MKDFLCSRDPRTHIKMQTDFFSSNGNSWNSTAPWMWMVCLKVLRPHHKQQQHWLNLFLALLPRLTHRITQVCFSPLHLIYASLWSPTCCLGCNALCHVALFCRCHVAACASVRRCSCLEAATTTTGAETLGAAAYRQLGAAVLHVMWGGTPAVCHSCLAALVCLLLSFVMGCVI